jgi:regulator of sigma E protease
MTVLIKIAAFIVALGVLIVIHEYGHYLIARLCGVKVLRFSIGFGKALWMHRYGPDATEWVIAAVPLGGYVKMLDEREGPVAAEELHRAFNRKSVWQRIAIVVAGPIANFLLAIVIYWAVFLQGVQELKPVVAAPEPGTIAAESGITQGETILKINGEPVASWQDVRWQLLQLAVEKQPVQIETLDAKQNLNFRTLDFTRFDLEHLEGDPLATLGLRFYRPEMPPVIGKIEPGTVSEAVGLRVGDRVISIDGRAMRFPDDVVSAVQASPGRPLHFRIGRGSSEFDAVLEPATVESNGKKIGRIGAALQTDPEVMKGLMTTVRYGPVSALSMALARTWETSAFSLKMLGKMVVGKISWKNLSGPVTIADYAGQSAQLGLGAFVAFLAMISISLGVLNLLPIPLLDGGHLLYYVVEILKGRPLSERAMELGQRLGLTVLLFLMVLALYNDINRQLTG